MSRKSSHYSNHVGVDIRDIMFNGSELDDSEEDYQSPVDQMEEIDKAKSPQVNMNKH